MSSFINIRIISHGFVLISLMLVFSNDQSFLFSEAFLDKVQVVVLNQLEPGKNLSIHCKSKDDDLGQHEVAYMDIYEWSFRINFWGTTLFWCNMAWQKGSPANQTVSGSFVIYKANRDWKRCGKSCAWEIEESGWYSTVNDYQWVNFYTWP